MKARRRYPLAMVALVAILASACSGGDTRDAEEVTRDSIRATVTEPRRFVYVDETPERTAEVTGVFEDDFRYQVALRIDDELIYEEVVQDDRIAVRVHDPRALELLRRPAAAEILEGEVGAIVGDLEEASSEEPSEQPSESESEEPAPQEAPPTEPDTDETADDEDGPDEVEQLLLSGVWVEDQVGAPSLLPSAETPDVGDDPVYDALTVLRYTQTAMQEGGTIDRFDPDSITYRPQEDPFEPPTEEAGEGERYDYQRVPLPSKSQVNESGQQPPPSMAHLRKMAVYLDRDNRVIRVEERVDILRRLKDLREKYDLIPPDGMSEDEQAMWALDQINGLRAKTGDDPIRFRSLSVRFEDVGDETLAVQMPSEATVASLRILRARGSETGRPPEPPEEESESLDEVPEPEVAPPGDEGDAASEG